MSIDLVFMAVAAAGFYTGFQRGFIKAIFLVFSFLVGFMVAVQYTPAMNLFLIDFFKMDSFLMPFLAFVLTFILGMLGLRIFITLGEGFLKSMNLTEIDRYGGGLLFALFALFLYSGIIWFLDISELISDDTKSESMFYPAIEQFLAQFDIAAKALIEGINGLWRRVTKLFNETF